MSTSCRGDFCLHRSPSLHGKMQILSKLIDNLKTQIAVDEEENKRLEERINSYTSAGVGYEPDKHVSRLEGEAERAAHQQPGEKSDDEQYQPTRKILIPESEVRQQTSPLQCKFDDTPISSYDEFFGPRFGLYDQIRKTLESQRRQEYQDFVHSKHPTRSEKSKVTQDKSKGPLRPDGSRRGLSHSPKKTPSTTLLKSATVVLKKPLTLVDKLVEDDRKKRVSASASKLSYREELALQIREKQRIQAEQREKERIADARLTHQVAEQRRRMKEEYEDEMRRIKRTSLSQPNLTIIGKSTIKSERDIKSPSYLCSKERALARQSQSPGPNQVKHLNGDEKKEANELSTNIKMIRFGETLQSEIKPSAEATLNFLQVTRKVIPLIPSVKANLAHQQHRMLVKLAQMKKT